MMHDPIRRRLSAYLEGELSIREEEALDAHLAECAACSAEFRAWSRLGDDDTIEGRLARPRRD